MPGNRWPKAVLILAMGMSPSLHGQTPKTQAPAADNTKINKTANAKPTADQQKQNTSDLEITRQIRQLVTKDKQLSTYAHNVKIITQNGNVTLSGPVNSADEKKSVEAKANQVAGAGHVKSEILIAAKQADKKK